jgi:ABC-2 type transport system ATP-binding protein
MSVANAVATAGLGKRYGPRWALQDCSIEIPLGRVCGLVGANGAGKSTLMRLLAGLSRPSSGRATVMNREPADDIDFLMDVGFLAQEAPLYRRWSARDHFELGARMNPRWDEALATERLRASGVPLEQPAGTLSGGQRAQVALALALGKRPALLLLDEPVAALDPLARRSFLTALAEAVVDGPTVVMSSHLVADLERVCDHLILLADAHPLLCGDIDGLLSEHKVLVGPVDLAPSIEVSQTVLRRVDSPRETRLWVRLDGPPLIDPRWHVDDIDLEELVLTYMALGPQRPTLAAGASQ